MSEMITKSLPDTSDHEYYSYSVYKNVTKNWWQRCKQGLAGIGDYCGTWSLFAQLAATCPGPMLVKSATLYLEYEVKMELVMLNLMFT